MTSYIKQFMVTWLVQITLQLLEIVVPLPVSPIMVLFFLYSFQCYERHVVQSREFDLFTFKDRLWLIYRLSY